MTTSLRLPTLAEIAATRAAKEAEARFFLEKTVPAAVKEGILRYLCDAAQNQVAAGAKNVALQIHPDACREKIIVQLQPTFDGLKRVLDQPLDLILNRAISTAWGDIPQWVAELPGFEDYEVNDNMLLMSKP
jgi:hypothetical protein